MNNSNNNIVAENNKPRLKKVKKPIKRVPPQMFNDAPKEYNNNVSSNPFQQQGVTPQSNFDPFDVDNLLDNTQLPTISSGKNNEYTPQFITDEPEYTPTQSTSKSLPDNKKMLLIAAAVAFLVGFIFGKIIGGEQEIVYNGLQDVIVNAEVPQGRPRCGKAPAGQGCVLYIMNPQRQDLSARDFYDLAAQLTGRQRFVVETGNMRYSNTKIRPGEIAQFNIPPLTQ